MAMPQRDNAIEEIKRLEQIEKRTNRMKSKSMAMILTCASFLVALGGMNVEQQKARDALQLINHINCAVSEITQSKDKLVLEREYNALTVDSLKLDSIGDYETIATIKSLMEAAKKLRISSVEREMLQEEIDQEMNDALYSAMPNIGSLASPNLLSTAVNLTVGAASAYANYEKQKKAIQRRATKANWEIDKNDLETLDSLNQDLLESHWRIVQRYKINDYERVTSRLITQMIEHFKDPNKKRRYEFFALHEKEYRTFTRYWYYRAVAAFDIGHKEDAYKSLESFQRIFLQIVRNDKIAALVAMMKVQLLLDRRWDDSEIRKQLAIIESNATLDDWNMLYFCGLVYADKLNDKEAARRVLKKAVNELSFKQEKRLSKFRGDLKTDKELHAEDIPSADALMICRTKLQLIDKDQREGEIRDLLLQSIEKENSFILDSLYYVGRTSDQKVFEKLLPDLLSISLQGEYHYGRKDSFYAYVPIKWFQVGEMAPSLIIGEESFGAEKRELSIKHVSDPYIQCHASKAFFKRLNFPGTSNKVKRVVEYTLFMVSARDGGKTMAIREMPPMVAEIVKAFEVRVKLRFRVEIGEIDQKNEVVVLSLPHKYCKVNLRFKLPKDGKGNFTDGAASLLEVTIDGNVFNLDYSDSIEEVLKR